MLIGVEGVVEGVVVLQGLGVVTGICGCAITI